MRHHTTLTSGYANVRISEPHHTARDKHITHKSQNITRASSHQFWSREHRAAAASPAELRARRPTSVSCSSSRAIKPPPRRRSAQSAVDDEAATCTRMQARRACEQGERACERHARRTAARSRASTSASCPSPTGRGQGWASHAVRSSTYRSSCPCARSKEGVSGVREA